MLAPSRWKKPKPPRETRLLVKALHQEAGSSWSGCGFLPADDVSGTPADRNPPVPFGEALEEEVQMARDSLKLAWAPATSGSDEWTRVFAFLAMDGFHM